MNGRQQQIRQVAGLGETPYRPQKTLLRRGSQAFPDPIPGAQESGGRGSQAAHQPGNLCESAIGRAICLLVDIPGQGQLPIDLIALIDLMTVWLLFPESRRYHSYRLLRYPEGDKAAAEPLTPRSTTDHPVGELIGFSVIKLRQGSMYETR